MAGYSKDREANYEIKYVRKVLGQVDERIQVPESISADSLRHLLDTVESPSVREVATRRPFKLSLQSGIACAAAFVLIVALFYSTNIYRPEIVSGGADISAAEQQSPAAFTASTQAASENEAITGGEAQAAFIAGNTSDTSAIDPIAIDTPDTATDAQGSGEAVQLALGVGGGGRATLVMEQDEYAYYWRENDLSDPDRTSPISIEVVDTATQETVTQTDVPLIAVAQSFELDGNIILIGNDFDGGAAICSYDVSDDGTFAESIFTQDGELLDASMHDNYVHVVSLYNTGETTEDSELLPYSISGEVCVITGFNSETGETVTKRFVGANGTVKLVEANAYIKYTGQDDNGETKEYNAQIIFDGMEIRLAD